MEQPGSLLLPSLMPHDWHGKAESVCRPLVDDPTGSAADSPLVGYGYDSPQVFEFLLKEEATRSVDEIHREAVGNLHHIALDWRVHEAAGGKLLECSGDYFASTKLLDRDFMLRAHELRGASLLAASVPSKTHLLVEDGADPSRVSAFLAFTRAQYDRANPRLSATVFIVTDGAVSGVIRPRGGQKGLLRRLFGG